MAAAIPAITLPAPLVLAIVMLSARLSVRTTAFETRDVATSGIVTLPLLSLNGVPSRTYKNAGWASRWALPHIFSVK